MRDITLIFAHYNNPIMANIQMGYYSSLPQDVRDKLHVILVDDCSEHPPIVPSNLGFAYSEYKILKHRRWDWLICRNLGQKEATTEWRLMTDIDHIVSEDALRYMQSQPLDPRKAYWLERKTLNSATDFTQLTEYKQHRDSWLMTGEAFDFVGRYWEDFSGAYGSSGHFTERVKRKMGEPITLPVHLWRVGRETVPDASTPKEIDGKPTRKTPDDRAAMITVRRKLANSGKPPMYLSLPWERVR